MLQRAVVETRIGDEVQASRVPSGSGIAVLVHLEGQAQHLVLVVVLQTPQIVGCLHRVQGGKAIGRKVHDHASGLTPLLEAVADPLAPELEAAYAVVSNPAEVYAAGIKAQGTGVDVYAAGERNAQTGIDSTATGIDFLQITFKDG